MFLTELSPLLRECLTQPIAFAGGVITGILHLNVNDEPVKTWLAKQGTIPSETSTASQPDDQTGPQSITID
jgi:hypothetical protein